MAYNSVNYVRATGSAEVQVGDRYFGDTFIVQGSGKGAITRVYWARFLTDLVQVHDISEPRDPTMTDA